MTTRELGRVCDAAVIAAPPAQRAEAMGELVASRRLAAVLVESPAATTLDGVVALGSGRAGMPIMAGANLLHAPAVRRVLDAAAAMDPHHVELRLSVPDPRRGPDRDAAFGGGVSMDPGSGFWPVLMAALGTAVTAVRVSRAEVARGDDRHVEVILHATGARSARAVLSRGAAVAQSSLEAAGAEHVARVEIWPVPAAEIDGAAVLTAAEAATNPVVALGFAAQLQRLARVAAGDAEPWPDLDVAATAVMIPAAVALSVKRGGAEVSVSDVPRDQSPFEILNG